MLYKYMCLYYSCVCVCACADGCEKFECRNACNLFSWNCENHIREGRLCVCVSILMATKYTNRTEIELALCVLLVSCIHIGNSRNYNL